MAKERLKSPRARMFVALDLPAAVRVGIVRWGEKALSDPALRPVPADSLHVTLAFLGWTAEKEVPRLGEIVEACAGAAPRITLGDPAPRPERGRPRLFALPADSPGAVALQASLEEKLVAAGLYEPEKRPFWPHLTVARVKPEAPKSRKPALIRNQPHPLPEHMFRFFRPTRLVLFRSHLRRTGAEYEPMAELELPTAHDDQETER
jgi:2'-5' RNA ligase